MQLRSELYLSKSYFHDQIGLTPRLGFRGIQVLVLRKAILVVEATHYCGELKYLIFVAVEIFSVC